MRYLFTLLTGLLLATVSVNAQSQNYELSAPVDIPVKEGWNKLIQMRNGNTLLFHLEPRKGILVKVFDNTHKEIASKKHICEVFDINILEKTDFKGLYEIGGEAVMFFEQDYLFRNSLFRLQFDATNGRLVKEEVVERSPSQKENINFHLTKNPLNDRYAIIQFKKGRPKVSFWNNKHEIVKEMPLVRELKGISGGLFLGMKYENNKLYVSESANYKDSNQANHLFIVNSQLSEIDTLIATQYMEVDRRIIPFVSFFSYNKFSESVNVLSAAEYFVTKKANNTTSYTKNYCQPYFAAYKSERFEMTSNQPLMLGNMRLPLAQTKDTLDRNYWVPTEVHTNKYGATMVVYEEQLAGLEFKNAVQYPVTILGKLGISILDDEGKELFSTLIPKQQTIDKLILLGSRSMNNCYRNLFRGNVIPEYYSQFVSFSLIPGNSFNHIILNDALENFDKKINDSLLTVNNYDYTSAICYTFNRKHELTKRYLFGTPTKDESTPCMLESAHYDESKKVYAAVILKRKGTKLETHVAWCHFDDAVNSVQ